jgi:hypothetical protein
MPAPNPNSFPPMGMETGMEMEMVITSNNLMNYGIYSQTKP